MPASLLAQSSADASASSAVLHPGDVVQVTVWRDSEMSGNFVVGANGALQHPLYQQVKVAGIPIPEVTKRLHDFLTHYQSDPQLVVVPLFRVTVGGEVRVPNLYSLPRETTISQAVAQAGGVTESGRLDHVRILRGGRVITADLTRPDGKWTNTPIQSGDEILVTRKGNFWRDVFVPLISVGGAIASIINVSRNR
ncbi:MAG TPA: polysaccharide biosynthesis/export family protein [Gemmatimonadaceae bacterium]|nr:polysaccharide biosynthesis/export family protein [Gemmatimonadaceae bacterium]